MADDARAIVRGRSIRNGLGGDPRCGPPRRHPGRDPSVPLLIDEAIRRQLDGWHPVVGQAADVLSDRVAARGHSPGAVSLVAVRGRPTPDFAATVLGVHGTSLHAAAEAARRQAVLIETFDGLDFRHARFGESWRDQMLSEVRRGWHRSIAKALSNEVGADAAEIAVHYFEAHEPAAGLPHAMSAARGAIAARAYGDALSMLCMVLGTDILDPPLRYELSMSAADCAHQVGEYPVAIECAQMAADLAALRSEDQLRALELLGWIYFRHSQSARSRASFDAARELMSDETDPSVQARVLAGQVMIRMWETLSAAGFAELRRMADLAMQRARASGDPKAVAVAASAMAGSEVDDRVVPDLWIEARLRPKPPMTRSRGRSFR